MIVCASASAFWGTGLRASYRTNTATPIPAPKMSTAWYELDLDWYLMATLRAVGLVRDVQVVSRDHTQKARAKEHRFRWHGLWQD